jgi:hypothetical protein
MAGPGAARFYSSTAIQTQLSSGIGSGTTLFTVGSVAGYPATTPFVISVDQNLATEELMLVTNVSSTQFTVTRGFNLTSAQSHPNGALVVHVACAQDLTDAGAHIGTYDNVHGLSVGSLVVGTTDAQTLTNKTLTAPIISTVINTGTLTLPTSTDTLVGRATTDTLTNKTLTSPTINTPTITSPTISSATLTGTTVAGPITSSGLVVASPLQITGLTGATATSRYVGATLGGAPVSGTFQMGDWIIDETGTVFICTTGGTPGTWNSPSTAGVFVGPGQTTNIATGGANRTSQSPFHYSTTSVVVTTSGAGWSFTTAGTTFHGLGSFHVSPGSQTNNLAFMSANVPTISGGNATFTGGAFLAGGSGLNSGLSIQINVSAFGW